MNYGLCMGQGKRKDQIEFSNMVAAVSMIVIIIISWIWKLVG